MDAVAALAALGIIILGFLVVVANDEALDRRNEAATKREIAKRRQRIAERYGISARQT